MTDPREMQAGPELDAAIAHEIFGSEIPHWQEGDQDCWREMKTLDGGRSLQSHRSLPRFSSDPAASAELRAKLWGMGFDYDIRVRNYFPTSGKKSFVLVVVNPSDARDGLEITVDITGPDPRPAEFLAVARCALKACLARKGAKA